MPSVGSVIPSTKKLERFLAQQQGGGDGIMRGYGTEAVCLQTDPLSLSVQVGAFLGFVSMRAIELQQTTVTAAVAQPVGGSNGDLRRIDLVQFSLGTARLNIKAGVEDAAPVAPDLDADSIPIAHLYLRKGMTSIKTADDAANGYIVDQRVYR